MWQNRFSCFLSKTQNLAYLASLKTLNRRNDLKAESAPPDEFPVAPVKMAGGERNNSNSPLITMKPSNRLKLSFAYSRGPSAAS